MICSTNEKTWVIEAKMELNWEAFGQVIGYELLYTVEHPNQSTQKAIVCGSVDIVIEALCKTFDITVFSRDEGFTPANK